MTGTATLTKKQLNHLMTLGTTLLANEGLIELAKELREKHKINLTAHEWKEDYKAELEENGTVEHIREEVASYLAKQQSEDENANPLTRTLTKILSENSDANAREVWDKLWPEVSEGIRIAFGQAFEGLTVKEALDQQGMNFLAGEMFAEEFANFVLTGELQAFPPQHLGTVNTDAPDMVIAVAGPLAIQEEVLEKFKKAMREKFPASSRSLTDRVGAACLAYHKMGMSDKEIALKIYDPNPNRPDYDRHLKQLVDNIRQKRKRAKEQLEKRL